MDNETRCDSLRVRVNTAHGRLEPCERLPLYYFSSESPLPARAREPGRVPAPAGAGRGQRRGSGREF